MKLKLALFCFFFTLSTGVFGHSGSTSYVEFNVDENEVTGTYWIDLTDLNVGIDLDVNRDGFIQFSEFELNRQSISEFTENLWQFSGNDESCFSQVGGQSLRKANNRIYAQIPISFICSDETIQSVQFSTLFELDKSHRVIATINSHGESFTHVFSPQAPSFEFTDSPYQWHQTASVFIKQGVIHILEGYDHLLFLLALLIPVLIPISRKKAVVSRTQDGIQSSLNKIVALFKIVTAFTIGHSITLVFASLSSFMPPAVWVETFIAASVLVAGVNIVVPLFRESSWRVAGLFGLIHGFGFANVLGELSIQKADFLLSLLSFNVGVELGQLMVILVAAPIILLFAKGYKLPQLARFVSAGIIVVIGAVWVAERMSSSIA